MVDKIVTAMGMAGGTKSVFLSNITPAPPNGPEHDLSAGSFSIGGEVYPNGPTTKSFTVLEPVTANVHVYGAGGGSGFSPPVTGGHGGKVLGTYTFQPGITYYMTTGGSGTPVSPTRNGSGGGGASAVWIAPQPSGQELFVAGGGGGGAGRGSAASAGVNGTGALSGAPSPWPTNRGERGGTVSPTTGGRAGTGRRTATAGGNAPRGAGGIGSDVPLPSGAGGGSGYAAGGRGGLAPGDGGGGGGGGGYAGGGGGNNDSNGYIGGGGNGYYHPDVQNAFGAASGPVALNGEGVFSGDPATSGQAGYAGSVIISLD